MALTKDELIARLESRVSDYKKEMGELLEMGQRWRIRDFIARKYLFQLNKQSPFWYEEDLTKELLLQEKKLVAAWKRREEWWKKL